MVEIQKRPFGCVAERTWRNANNMMSDLPDKFRQPAREHLNGSVSTERAVALQKLLESAIDAVQRDERNQRLKHWTLRMQSSTRAVHAWIKHTAESSSICFANENGTRTANIQSLFAAVRQAWCSVHELFKMVNLLGKILLTSMDTWLTLHLLRFRVFLEKNCGRNVLQPTPHALVLTRGCTVT